MLPRGVELEGVYPGAQTPEAYAALWRGRRENGGALILAGSASWLIHSVLMIVGLVAIFSVSLTDMNAASRSIFAALMVFIAATVAVLLATFLLGAGLLLYQGGTLGMTSHEWWSGVTHYVSPGTRTKAKAGAVFVIMYGILGIIVIGIYAGLMNSASNLDFSGALNGLRAILALWIVASVFLIVGSALVASFLNSLRMETATLQSFSGTGFVVYSILSAVGVFLFAGSLLALASNPLAAQVGLIVPIMIGGVIGLLVVPIAGMVVFSLMIAYGLRLRKLQPGARPAPGSYPPAPSVLGMYYTGPAALPPPPGAGYPLGVATAVPYNVPANPLPPPPLAYRPAANPQPPAPLASPMFAGGDGSWVLRMETEIGGLQRAVTEQKDFLFQVERSLVEGRIDSATYSDIVRKRTDRITELEGQIQDAKSRIAKASAGNSGSGSEAGVPGPPENP